MILGKGQTLEYLPPRKLGERIAWITAKVGPIVATGNNQYDRDGKAMSIMDVEGALAPLFAEAGVVTNWSVTTAALIDKVWRLDFHVTISASDNPQDKIEADWMDIGNSPSAARSFAVKGYYRCLFHLADAEDHQPPGIPPIGDVKKPATLRRYAGEIKKTWPAEGAGQDERSGVNRMAASAPAMTPAQPPQEAQADASGSVAQEEAVFPSSPVPLEDEVAELFALSLTLDAPPTLVQVRNKVAKNGVTAVRRELFMAHKRDHGPACSHLAALAGLR